jgi:hypothetical protein
MQTKQLIPILFLVFFGCTKERVTEIPIDNKLNEVPASVFVLKPCSSFDSIKGLFSETAHFVANIPAFLSDTVQKKIVITKECNVYVTFITERAGYKNTLGWYSYKNTQPPLVASDINKNILFPNISRKGQGGELEIGYTLNLSEAKFPVGTVIGFFLVVAGWNETGFVDYNRTIYYTNYELNVGGKQQHILYKESNCHNIILGFEDLSFDLSDKDFNDVIITISDNKEGYETTSFDLNRLIVK